MLTWQFNFHFSVRYVVLDQPDHLTDCAYKNHSQQAKSCSLRTTEMSFRCVRESQGGRKWVLVFSRQDAMIDSALTSPVLKYNALQWHLQIQWCDPLVSVNLLGQPILSRCSTHGQCGQLGVWSGACANIFRRSRSGGWTWCLYEGVFSFLISRILVKAF